jgi:hypothetical protein
VQPLFVAPCETGRQRTRLTQARPQNARDEILHIIHAFKADSLRLQVQGFLRCEVHVP